MAQKFKLLVGTGKNQVAQTIDIEQGTGNQANPVTVKAQAGMRYQLAQANSPQAPHNVRAKRVGKDLQVFIEDSKQADLVIQNYYDEIPANVNALVGQAENGTVYSYIPENANAAGLIPNLTDGGNTVGMALGNYEEFMLAGAPVAAAGGIGLGALAAGIGLAALAGGGGGGTSAAVSPIAASTTPSGQTGALAAASDSGTADDNLTQVKSPTIAGKAEAGAKVEVTVNGKIYKTTADANGNYSVIIPDGDALADGTYTPQIKVINATGESTANGTPFTIDTKTSVAITDPGKGTTTNAISGTGEAGATVVVKDAQNATIGIAVVDKDGHWTLTPTTAVVIGQLSAVATDTSGNTAYALSNNTGVAPPAPAITSVTDNVQGLAGSIQKYITGNVGGLDKGVTNDNTPTISGTAAAGATVTLYDAGKAVGTALVGPDGQWTITPTLTTDGVHTFTAHATLAGLSSPDTGEYPIYLDTTNPTPPVVDPTGNSTNTGTGTGNTFAVIDTVGSKTGVVVDQSTIDDATPTINGKGEVGSTITIYDKGQALGTALVGADGKWSFKSSTAFANGSTHTITTTITDTAGNTSAISGSTTFNIDTSNTPVQLTSVVDDVAVSTGPLAQNALTNDNKPTLTGTGTPNTTVTITDKGTAIGTALVDAQGNWTFTPTNALSEGAHSFVVSGTDKANNASSTAAFALTIDTQAPTAPVISVFGDDVGTVQNPNTPTAQYTDDTTPTLKGTAEANSTVTIKDASGTVVGVATTDSSGNWSYTLAKLAKEGTYTYTATAMDAAGNTSGNSNTFSLKLDTTAPTGQTGALATVVSSDSGTLGDNITSVRTPTITGSAEANAKVEVTVNGITYTTTADANGSYSVSIPSGDALSTNTTYTPVIKATDAAGNASTSNGTPFTVIAAPTNAGMGLAVAISTDTNNDGYVNTAELGNAANFTSHITVNNTAVVGDRVIISVTNGSTALTPITRVLTAADIANGFDVTFTKPTEGTVQTVTANYVDAAGNTATDAIKTDSATLGTNIPTNAGVGLTVTISTDANNDGYVNTAELGNAANFTSHITVNNTAVVGDRVIISVTNGSTALTPITRVLTAADIANGFDVTFTKPTEGTVQTVTANYVNAIGNAATDTNLAALTDSARLDTTPPTNAGVGLTVAISTDTNNDGYVNTAELGNAANFTSHITVNNTAVVGDRVIISATNGSTALTPITRVLTAADIANGFDVTFTKPTEGTVQTVTANYVDAAGNAATDTNLAALTDSATLDTTAYNGVLTLNSILDNVTPQPDGSSGNYTYSTSGGTTNDTSPLIQGTVGTLAAGETVHIFRGGVDIGVATVNTSNGTWTFQDGTGSVGSATAALASGATYSYTAKVIDAANNVSAPTTGFAITVDTSTPTLVADVANATEASATSSGSTVANFGANPRGNMLGNDSVGSGATLSTVTGTGAAIAVSNGSTDINNPTEIVGTYGTLRVGADGSYTYFLNNDNATVDALNANSIGLTDTFIYSVKNAAGTARSSTLTVNIHGAADFQTTTGTVTGSGSLTQAYWSQFTNGFVDHVGLISDFDGDGRTDLVYDQRYGIPSAIVLSSQDYAAADAADGTVDGKITTSNILKQAHSFAITVAQNGTSLSADSAIASMGDVDGDGLSDFMVSFHNPSGAGNSISNYFLSSRDLSSVLALPNHTITEDQISTLTHSYSFATGNNWHSSPLALNLSNSIAGKEMILTSTFDAWLVSPSNFEAMDLADGTNDNIVSLSQNFNTTATGGTAFFYHIHNNTGNTVDRSVGNIGDAGDLDNDGLHEMMMYDPYAGQSAGDAAFYLLNSKDLAQLSALSGTANTINLRDVNSGTNSYEFRGLAVGTNRIDMERAGDVNGDGKGDVLMSSMRDGTVWLVSGNDLESIDGADNTNDNQIDLINVSKGASSYVFSSNLANYADLGINAGMHRAFGIGDIDGDGKSDLFLKNDVTGTGYIVLAKDLATMDANSDHKINIDTDWNKAGTSGYKITGLSTQFTNSSNATDSGLKLVSSGDIDGDGLSDFVVAEGDLGTIRTFLSSKLATYDAADGSTDHTIAASATGTSTVAGSVNNDILGSSGNDVLSGGSNDNTLYGNGGSDVIYAGAGNDRIVLNASNVAALTQTGAYIDGGTGSDTLVLDGSGIFFDFTTLQSKVVGIEKIDLTGTGNNTLKLSLADVIAVSDTHNLYVTGNAGDNVQIKGTSFTPTATTVSGVAYNDYNLDGNHHLYVQQAVTAVFVA